MSRLIDADLLEEILDVNIQILQNNIDDATTEVQKLVYEAQEFSTMEMIRVIKEQPTAFDVDKVVEKLEENSFDMDICEEQFDMNSPYFMDIPYKILKLQEAIDIVKLGGKDMTNMWCIDCPMATYRQGIPYCKKEERHLDSFSYKPDWCTLKAGGIDE